MPRTDDLIRLDTAAEHPVRGVRGPLTVLVSVRSLTYAERGPEAVFTRAGIPLWEALGWEQVRTEGRAYEMFSRRVPFHMPGEPGHPYRGFVPPLGWPAVTRDEPPS